MVIQEPDYGSGSRAVPLTEASAIKYIRITDFDDEGIPPGHEFVTASLVEERYRLEEDDLLFARTGATVGKTYIHSRKIGPAIFAGYCIRFRFDSKKVLPEFVYYYTKSNRYRLWVQSIQRPSGQPNINKEEFKAFTIPLPPLGVQRQLVAEVEKARETRKRKLQKADALLNSLDEWLLQKLGLKAPSLIVLSSFAIRLAQCKHGRVDVSNFQQAYVSKPGSLMGKYQNAKLADIAHIIMGQAPLGEHYNEEKKGIPLIAGAADLGAVYPAAKKWTILAPKQCAPNDIILCIRATIGTLNWADRVYCLGRGVAGISARETTVLPEYLYEALHMRRTYLTSRGTGSTFKQVIAQELADCPIPLPPMKIQRTIAAELNRRRDETRRLRAEAATEWDAAKRRFEQSLLGIEA